MAESAFQSSLRAFQSRGSAAPTAPAPTNTGGVLGSINPQRWLSSMRDDEAAHPSDEGRGLLSGIIGSSTSNSANSGNGVFDVLCGCFPPMSTYNRFIAFACCTGGGLLFFMISFFMLPMVVIAPQKFAFLSCIGSALLFSSIGFLRGWPSHMAAVFAKDRWPFTVGYLLSLVGGLWSSVVIHSYILTILFIVIHTVALVWYYVSFLPGGPAGLRAMTGMLANGGRSLLPV
ncbi:protein transport protein sft2 [Blastocladiella emersonii ATCC 22665]|nr:protein transport protein sft2 [Blastocladiella emersonii ATCC 22665]